MTKKRFWLGFLILALVFGMIVNGCDDSTSDSSLENEGEGNTGSGPIITLGYNQYGTDDSYWQYNYNPVSLLKGSRFLTGDQYVFTYSFKSSVNIDKLQIVLVDTTEAASHWEELSNYIVIGEKISANTIISGTKTITVTKNATSSVVAANTLVFQASKATSSSPKLTFSAFSFGKPGSENPTNYYTVTFNSNGGTGTVPISQTVSAGSSITLPSGSGLSRSGYFFKGWNDDSSGTGITYSASSSFTPIASTTLYAQWSSTEEKTCTVSYNINGGTGTTPASQTVYDNSSITLASGSGFSRSGYSFGGWNTNSSGTGTNYSASSSFVVNSNITLYARWVVVSSNPEGIYVGIVKFANTAEDITYDAPVLLNSAGKTTILSRLTNNYTIASQIGTSMFYGVHKALENLKKNEASYPTNLDTVNIVTFTDGLDNQSAGLSRIDMYTIEGQKFDNNNMYSDYIRSQIDSRKISGVSIDAYSVGVRGGDVTDITAFQNNLAAIASPGKSQELSNFSDVQSTFNAIADGLNITHTSTSFTMVTNLLDGGTKVRMTFDVNNTSSTSAQGSTRYIEGTMNVSGSTYTLTNITYGSGISSDENVGPITGTIVGTQINFTFNNITGYNPNSDLSNTRQWLIAPGSTASWQHNSEYNSTGSSSSSVEKRSAIIYLILDCSTSLSTTEIGQIRTAAINFINSLYDRYNQ